MSDLERAVQTVVNHCLGVRPGEGVVVVASPGVGGRVVGADQLVLDA